MNARSLLAIFSVSVALVGVCAWSLSRADLRLFADSKPPLPSLLAGAQSTGGVFAGCEDPAGVARNLSSPEIASRLAQIARPGAPAARLEAMLRTQGFTLIRPCVGGHIFSAQFRQQGGGYPGYAVLWWSVDDRRRIVWANGNIFYVGL